MTQASYQDWQFKVVYPLHQRTRRQYEQTIAGLQSIIDRLPAECEDAESLVSALDILLEARMRAQGGGT